MKYLVTGGNGQLGDAFKKVLSKEDTTFTDVDDLNVVSKEEIFRTVKRVEPDIVLHCAALTNVDGCEANESLADKINHLSVKYLAEACNEANAVLVYISTDYVFPGDAIEPYKVEAKTGPKSVYGRTKLLGEEETKKTAKHYIFRTSWVYGEGHNFVNTMLMLSEKMDEIKVVDDQIGRPTYASDLASAIFEVIRKELPLGSYHFTNKGIPISWAEFAKTIFEIAGKKTKVIPISTKEYLEMNAGKKVASRPSYSVLDLLKIEGKGIKIPEWKKSLEQYLMK